MGSQSGIKFGIFYLISSAQKRTILRKLADGGPEIRKMPERSIAEIMNGLDPLLDDFDLIARSGFAKYRGYPADVLVDHDARAAASCTYCHILAGAEAGLTGRPGVVAKDIQGLKVWLIGETAVIRWKRMNEAGLVAVYPTQQTLDYFDQGVDLPGLPAPAARLSVGYFLDPTATEYVRTQVAREESRKRIDWCAAIVPPDDRASGEARWRDVTVQRRISGL